MTSKDTANQIPIKVTDEEQLALSEALLAVIDVCFIMILSQYGQSFEYRA